MSVHQSARASRSQAAAPRAAVAQLRGRATGRRARPAALATQASKPAPSRFLALPRRVRGTEGPSPFSFSEDSSSRAVAARAASASGNGSDGGEGSSKSFLSRQVAVIREKWTYFMPMCVLFFFMAFNNTIFDSTKDTLLITAVGGAEQIPFVTLYAVLPASCLFLFLFSVASRRYSRRRVFNYTIGIFIAFFVLFAHVLYPNRHAIHNEAFARWAADTLPQGLQGLGHMMHQVRPLFPSRLSLLTPAGLARSRLKGANSKGRESSRDKRDFSRADISVCFH